MTKNWRVRDALHGFIELNKYEQRVVDSRPYQRLRHIRQLGMAHMVYPGANHTRFEHCLGCVEITSRMYNRISTGSSEGLWKDVRGDTCCERLHQIARFAALTHDLGHSPFSHSAEHLFQAPTGWHSKDFSHESQTARIIRETEVFGIINDSGIDPEEVIAVATDFSESKLPNVELRHDLEILNGILTSEIGSDRCDYLLRDAYHSGQPAGSIDLDRLVQQVSLIDHEGAVYFGVLEGGRLVVEQMIANRYAAYIDLYFHKTKRAYERHLVAFLDAWLDGGCFPTDLDSFLDMTDSTIESAISEAIKDKDHPAHGSAICFNERRHFRKVFERVPLDRKGVVPEKIAEFVEKCTAHLTSSGFVDIVDHSGTKIKSHRILVMMDHRTRYLDELAELISGLQSRIWRLRVYSPIEKRGHTRTWCGNAWSQIVSEESI